MNKQTYLEKKYAVDSFEDILTIISLHKLPLIHEATSIHYYGHHEGKDVEKLVASNDKFKIHILKEKNGQFQFVKKFEVATIADGLTWLKNRGFSIIDMVKMQYKEYAYKDGTIGLYTIDDFLHSIILYFPVGEHELIVQELQLKNIKAISIPYNQLLSEIDKLRTIELV